MEQQEIDKIPTIHLGAAASQMENRGIRTGLGNLSREIKVTNQRLRQLKVRNGKLQNWLKEKQENLPRPPWPDAFKTFYPEIRGFKRN